MKPNCQNCKLQNSLSEARTEIVRAGFFRRKSDGRVVQRFRCKSCLKYFSLATAHPCYRQKKRQFNERIKRLYCSSVSLRRMAKIFGLSRTTIKRKFLFIGRLAEIEQEELNSAHLPSNVIEFDDLETFEHTKYKPLSVTLAVES